MSAAEQKDRADKAERALAIVASVLLGEQTRSGGEPFSGQWNIITHDWRGTVDDAIDLADATLQKFDATTKQGGQG